MHNILDFTEYKRQVRLYEERLVLEQIKTRPVNEGLLSGIRKKINEKAGIFVREALSEEIEMGTKLNEQIQEAVKELKDYIDKIQQAVDDSNPEKSELIKKLEKIFEDIRKSSFELLEILSGVNINFADYVQNAVMATFVNFGVLFIPTRSRFLLKKSYKYFIGLIKNTIRKDMLMLMLNFDQFENTVLIQSLEDDEQNEVDNKVQTRLDAYDEFARRLITGEGGKKRTLSKAEMDKITKVAKSLKDGIAMQMKLNDRRNGAIGFDTRYDNTYTKTLDQLKSFVLEDDTKYLEAIKNGMRAQALDEVDTKSYVELLISAAEECAFEVSAAIHTNFIDKVSVFKLANQKRLIELVKKDKELAERKREEERKKAEEELLKKDYETRMKVIKEKGPEIFKTVVEDHKDDGDEQKKAYLKTGKKKIKEGDKEYTEKEILDGWLSLFDDESDSFKNWKDNEEKIEPLLKLYLNEVIPNEDSYLKYSDLLVDCLLPCAHSDGEGYIKLKDTITYTFSESESASEKKENIEKVNNCPVFTVYKLKNADERERRLKEVVFKKDGDDFTYELDDDLTKLLKEALKLISDNILHIEKDVIYEVLCHLYTKDDESEEGFTISTYMMSKTIMKDIIKQLERLKELKDNDYGETTKEESKESEKSGDSE
jgi:Mg2+ and Co2+ transporter CorA